MHCPGGNATDPIWRGLASSDGISSWTPLKPQHSIPCWLSVQWEPSACRSCQCCQKKGSSTVCGWICSVWPSWVWESQHASTVNSVSWSLGHQSIKNCRIWTDQLDHLPAVMTTSFSLIFSEHPWDKLRTNLPHLQFLVNYCVYSSHNDIKLCTYCLYRPTTFLIHEILYLAKQLWCSNFLTPPLLLIIPLRLPAFLESLMQLKNWCSIHARLSKSILKHSTGFCGIFPSLKQNFLAYRSSKVSSRPDCIFEIHQQWQSGFRRVFSNSCCRCAFEPEIIKISRSSYKMYSSNILNFTILNACTKKVWNLIEDTSYMCLKEGLSMCVLFQRFFLEISYLISIYNWFYYILF